MGRWAQIGRRQSRGPGCVGARRHLLFLAIMAFMLSHLGQDCTISCNPTPPPSCLACTGNQVVVCDSFCATPRAQGQSCNYTNPCDPNDLRACDTGLVCMRNPSGFDGICQPDTVGHACDPFHPCGSPEICRTCPAGASSLSTCALPLQAGLPCLPDPSNLQGDLCSQCAPGLICYAPPGSTGQTGLPYPGTCVLEQPGQTMDGTCTSDAQCNACAGASCLAVEQAVDPLGVVGLTTLGPPVVVISPGGGGSTTGQCRTCAQGVHAPCSQQTPCCAGGQECSFATGAAGAGGCCETLGFACPGGLSDCCPGVLYCRSTTAGATPTCAQCADQDQYCTGTGTGDCCAGLRCVANKCRCGAPGTGCSGKIDCCANEVCTNKYCEACTQYGNSCTTPADCCPGVNGCTAKSGKKGICCSKPGDTCTLDTDCCAGPGITCDTTGHCQQQCDAMPEGPCGGSAGPCCPGLDCVHGSCCELAGATCLVPGTGANAPECCSQTCNATSSTPTNGGYGVCK